MTETEYPIITARKYSSNHRDAILSSCLCGCFHCLEVYPPNQIQEWVDEINAVGTTAICPRCGIDSVIGSSSGYPIESDFLKAMARQWFGRGSNH